MSHLTIVKNKIDFDDCLYTLTDWFDFHHGGCTDQTTCTMSEARDQGLDVLAIQLLVDAIGFDPDNSYEPEFEKTAMRCYEEVTTTYKKRWEKWREENLNELLEIEHMDCKECNAVIWQPSLCGGYCSSCGEVNNETITN